MLEEQGFDVYPSAFDKRSDMLTRIRNASQANFKTVDIPASNMKRDIAEILFNEGYIKAYEEIKNDNQGIIRVSLKYTEKGKKVIAVPRKCSQHKIKRCRKNSKFL